MAEPKRGRLPALLPVIGLLRPYKLRLAGACLALLFTAAATLSLGRGIQVLIDRGLGGGTSEDYFLAGRGLSWWLIGSAGPVLTHQAPIAFVACRPDGKQLATGDLMGNLFHWEVDSGKLVQLATEEIPSVSIGTKSDADVALVLTGALSSLRRGQLRVVLALARRAAGVRFDVRLLDELPTAVRGRVVSEGRLVFERDPILRVRAEVAARYAPRVLLADEVGLGKTIEAGMILHQQLLTGRANRVLIVVPPTLLHQSIPRCATNCWTPFW